MTVAFSQIQKEHESSKRSEIIGRAREDSEMVEEEEILRRLRSKATELLIREEWEDAVDAYSRLILHCKNQVFEAQESAVSDPDQIQKLRKSLCLAFSSRAEVQFRLRDLDEALKDCEEALKIEDTHFKTLLCKGKILMNLDSYSVAIACFERALLDPKGGGKSENLYGYLEKCRKLEFLSRSGAFDLSDWIVNGFQGNAPDLAEYKGPVEIKTSEISGRGIFATKNIDSGTILFVTKAIAIERGILPQEEDPNEKAKLEMWTSFVQKISKSAEQCARTQNLIGLLSMGESEIELEIPDMDFMKPETAYSRISLDRSELLTKLDVNSLVEEAASATVLGKNRDFHGVGLWILPSFINHSCTPNARRLHIGDYAIVLASRDVKSGEEITFSYFDVFSRLENRREMAKTWGFVCKCKRCRFEEEIYSKEEMREIENGLERETEAGLLVYKTEELMKKWRVRGKEKGFLRASFWGVYSETYSSEKMLKRWGRRIPAIEAVVDSVTEAVGSHERVVKVAAEDFRRRNGRRDGIVETERLMKLGRGVYGKTMKKQALRSLLQLGFL